MGVPVSRHALARCGVMPMSKTSTYMSAATGLTLTESASSPGCSDGMAKQLSGLLD